jgi:hypothetical protein
LGLDSSQSFTYLVGGFFGVGILPFSGIVSHAGIKSVIKILDLIHLPSQFSGYALFPLSLPLSVLCLFSVFHNIYFFCLGLQFVRNQSFNVGKCNSGVPVVGEESLDRTLHPGRKRCELQMALAEVPAILSEVSLQLGIYWVPLWHRNAGNQCIDHGWRGEVPDELCARMDPATTMTLVASAEMS